MCIDLLVFIPATFNENLAFIQLIIGSYWLNIRIYIIYIVV